MKIKCTVCGHENTAGIKFCVNCGAPMDQPQQKLSQPIDDISEEKTVMLDPRAMQERVRQDAMGVSPHPAMPQPAAPPPAPSAPSAPPPPRPAPMQPSPTPLPPHPGPSPTPLPPQAVPSPFAPSAQPPAPASPFAAPPAPPAQQFASPFATGPSPFAPAPAQAPPPQAPRSQAPPAHPVARHDEFSAGPPMPGHGGAPREAMAPPPAPAFAPAPAAPARPAVPAAPVAASAYSAPAAAPAAAEGEPAGFWIRLAAWLIDNVLLGIVIWLVGMVLALVAGGAASAGQNNPGAAAAGVFAAFGMFIIVALITSPIYFIVMIALKGQTVGKMAMGIKVVNMDGSQPSWGPAILRFLGYLVSNFICYIGYLIAAFRADKRALHDLIAGTRVIKVR